jgi:hypothetical protein
LAVATLWERKDAYNLLAYTSLFLRCRNWDWSWSWDWLRFWSTNVQIINGKSAVLIGWLFSTALLETRLCSVVATVAALGKGKNAKDFFANACRGYRLWCADCRHWKARAVQDARSVFRAFGLARVFSLVEALT